ncbi:MAG TPA: CehA/McbA family metallohydrolase [Phycisphaerae bacterium]|nr:CehA/McbA family metallohydrolase [Phycisphaerae bacterium]
MATYRYDTSGQWLKGNVHIHSTASDGGKTFAELAKMYARAGYDFLFRTDHWVCSDVAADAADYPLLWLDGIELDGQDARGRWFHVVGLGRVTNIEREMGLDAAMAAVRSQGALLVLAHPHWCGNTMDDALRGGFDGVEVYNHVCHWLNGKSGGGAYWSAMLDRDRGVLAFAVDDAHLRPEHPGWNGGWIVVNAPSRTAEAIAAAVRAGRFYCSCGPEFHSIDARDGQVRVATSPVAFARLVGPGWLGRRAGAFDGQTLTEATFELPEDWAWAYVEIEDPLGRRAWTNTLVVDA